jgi:signal transduction histidine kinase
VRFGFRARLFAILALFAAIPALVVASAGVFAFNRVVPLLSGSAAWDSVASSGAAAVSALTDAPLSAAQRGAIDAHAAELEASVTSARQVRFLADRLVVVFAVSSLIGFLLLIYVTSRVAGHLSRQLSRPLDELVGWTGCSARAEPLPPPEDTRGAPEFAVLRDGMLAMSAQLATGRQRAMEAERLRAFRESSRRFAHELKNPLTPIRFAIDRLRRDLPAESTETLDVLATESKRLEAMAKAFAQFGRLPEGPAAEVDLGELVTYTAKATVPDGVALSLDIEAPSPTVRGHYDSLARAFSNILLNAVEACGAAGAVRVHVCATRLADAPAVQLTVEDSGPGIAAVRLPRIWEPYETEKPGGTGLGLAIARQAVEAHGGVVFAESERGGPTRVGFVLPVNTGLPAITGEWRAPQVE